jgi:hypothetical protein
VELPTFKQFIETAKLLRHCVYEEKMGYYLESKFITPEIGSIDRFF